MDGWTDGNHQSNTVGLVTRNPPDKKYLRSCINIYIFIYIYIPYPPGRLNWEKSLTQGGGGRLRGGGRLGGGGGV